MNTPSKGAIRPNSVLSVESADRLDRDVRRLAAEAGDLLTLAVDQKRSLKNRADADTLGRLDSLLVHLRNAHSRLEKCAVPARQLWNEAVAAADGADAEDRA
jgi:hypothetical protein